MRALLLIVHLRLCKFFGMLFWSCVCVCVSCIFQSVCSSTFRFLVLKRCVDVVAWSPSFVYRGSSLSSEARSLSACQAANILFAAIEKQEIDSNLRQARPTPQTACKAFAHCDRQRRSQSKRQFELDVLSSRKSLSRISTRLITLSVRPIGRHSLHWVECIAFVFGQLLLPSHIIAADAFFFVHTIDRQLQKL